MAKRITDRDESLDLRDKSLRCLGKKKDAKIFGNRILVLNGKSAKHPKTNDIGIKTWGMIDGLCKYHGYRSHMVNDFNAKT